MLEAAREGVDSHTRGRRRHRVRRPAFRRRRCAPLGSGDDLAAAAADRVLCRPSAAAATYPCRRIPATARTTAATLTTNDERAWHAADIPLYSARMLLSFTTLPQRRSIGEELAGASGLSALQVHAEGLGQRLRRSGWLSALISSASTCRGSAWAWPPARKCPTRRAPRSPGSPAPRASARRACVCERLSPVTASARSLPPRTCARCAAVDADGEVDLAADRVGRSSARRPCRALDDLEAARLLHQRSWQVAEAAVADGADS